eukprot:88573-Pleurochrysis_carterae.AAC.1
MLCRLLAESAAPSLQSLNTRTPLRELHSQRRTLRSSLQSTRSQPRSARKKTTVPQEDCLQISAAYSTQSRCRRFRRSPSARSRRSTRTSCT